MPHQVSYLQHSCLSSSIPISPIICPPGLSSKRRTAALRGNNYLVAAEPLEVGPDRITNYPQTGRWENETNNGNGTFQIIDLSSVYQLNGVGYNMIGLVRTKIH